MIAGIPFEYMALAIIVGLLILMAYFFGNLTAIKKYQRDLDELQMIGNKTFIKIYEIEKHFFKEMKEKFPQMSEIADKNLDRVNHEISKLKDQ